jgi:hypothetical protein
MVEHLRTDGLTFLGNKHWKFSRIDPLFFSKTPLPHSSTLKDHGRGMTMRRATRATAKFEIRKCRTDSLASTELCGSSSEKHQLQSRPRSHLQSQLTRLEGILDELTEVTDPPIVAHSGDSSSNERLDYCTVFGRHLALNLHFS